MQPMVTATLITPEEYFKPVLAACDSAEGMRDEVTWLGEDGKRAMVKYRFKMASIISDFFSKVRVNLSRKNVYLMRASARVFSDWGER